MKYLLTLTILALPVVVSAQALSGFFNIAEGFANIVNLLVPVMISLAFIYFVWGIVRYVLAKDPEKQKEARGTIVWGVISITVIVGVWGIASFLLGNLGVSSDVDDVNVPTISY